MASLFHKSCQVPSLDPSICVLAGAGLMRAAAHQELCHDIEVDLAGTAASGVVELLFTIHAPELPVGFSEAADAVSALIRHDPTDAQWDKQCKEARGLLRMLGRDEEFDPKTLTKHLRGGAESLCVTLMLR